MSCFWSHGKILFLAEIIAGQRLALIVIVLLEQFSITRPENRV